MLYFEFILNLGLLRTFLTKITKKFDFGFMNIINIYIFNTNSNSSKSNLKIFLEIILQIISKLCQNLVEKHINIFITY